MLLLWGWQQEAALWEVRAQWDLGRNTSAGGEMGIVLNSLCQWFSLHLWPEDKRGLAN